MATPAAPLRELYTLPGGLKLSAPEPPHSTQLSPNHSRREFGPIDTIVIHCTAGANTAGAVATLLDPNHGASAHIVIPDDRKAGEPRQTVRLVPDAEKAWHVRRNVLFMGKQDLNARSFGIEIVNPATAGASYSEWQVAEAARWCRHWISEHPSIRWIVTHGYADPSRRSDPCITFPWEAFLAQVTAGADTHQTAPSPLKFIVMGKVLDLDGDLHEGAVYAELRPLLEVLGVTIAYDGATHTVTIGKAP